MANSSQARKRARQNTARRQHNRGLRSRMRTAVKRFLKAVNDGNRETADAAYRAAVSLVDSMAGKGIHHRNRAARMKSRMNSRLRGLG